jgi:Ser/Thr protein kinase RdoA (MazF antagonist)
MIMALGLSTPMTSELVRIYTTLQGWIETIAVLLPIQRLYADLYSSNKLIDKGMVSGFLNLKFVSVGPGFYDLAFGLWAYERWHGADRSDWQRAKAFLAAYASTVPPHHAGMVEPGGFHRYPGGACLSPLVSAVPRQAGFQARS